MQVEWEDGAELSRSQKRPGHFSPLTRDRDNNLVGQVTLSDVDDVDDGEEDEEGSEWTSDSFEEEPSWGELLTQAEEVIDDLNVILNDLYRWWHDREHPAIESFKESIRNRVARKRKAGRPASDTGWLRS